jgi:hypothetical protein
MVREPDNKEVNGDLREASRELEKIENKSKKSGTGFKRV